MDESVPSSPTTTDRGRILGQIVIALVVIVLLVNVPISYRGAGLIHSVPDATPVIIYNGIVLKGSGPAVYVLENHKLRPFSSSDTFNHFRQRYHLNVQTVDDQLLTQFEPGQPIRRLVKCNALPQVYALENGQKRLAANALLSDSFSRWDKVDSVVCSYLRTMTDGSPISDEGG